MNQKYSINKIVDYEERNLSNSNTNKNNKNHYNIMVKWYY